MISKELLDQAASNPTSKSFLPINRLCGNDPAMLAMLTRARLLIDRQLPILILGETGTGKEYLARALHRYSRRRSAAMVPVNCGSIPENLIESELFGYARGAFSGALSTGMKGKIALANDGTLFLDEIGDMPCAQQTRLLRVLSENEVTPIGSGQPIMVDVQLICATNQNIEFQVENGAFREDLYYRIAVGIIHLPPLRERLDLEWLIDSLLQQENPGMNFRENVDAEARDLLTRHQWPGNLRQLHAAIRYACAVKTTDIIRTADLPLNLQPVNNLGARASEHLAIKNRTRPISSSKTGNGLFPVDVRSDSIGDTPYTAPNAAPLSERDTIIRALSACRWNISAASRDLGICRASLYRKLQQFRIPHVRDIGSDIVRRF